MNETKICNRCGIEKPITEFTYRKKEKQYRNPCKECRNKYLREYSIKNKEKLKDYRDNYYVDNRDKKLEYQKEYAIRNKDDIQMKQKNYRSKHITEIKQYKKDYYSKNKDAISEKNKEYYIENSTQIRECRKEYSKNNRDKINSYVKNRKQTDKIFKLKLQLRNIILDSFKRRGNKKSYSSEKLLGCDIDFFTQYLMDTFYNNYGYEWNGTDTVHIDHIIPLSTAKTEDDVIRLCHYTNLQLLKPEDNLSKSNKLDWELK